MGPPFGALPPMRMLHHGPDPAGIGRNTRLLRKLRGAMASSPPIGTRKAFAPAGTMDATFPNTATLLSHKRHTRHKNLLTEKAPYKGGTGKRIPLQDCGAQTPI